MHATTCLMHVLATVFSFVGQLIVASCRPVFWPRVRVCAHTALRRAARVCTCVLTVIGEAVSMSERSERILTMSEALV